VCFDAQNIPSWTQLEPEPIAQAHTAAFGLAHQQTLSRTPKLPPTALAAPGMLTLMML
jgi:hypothetical protein